MTAPTPRPLYEVRPGPIHGPTADCRAVVCGCKHTPAQVAELLHLHPSERPALADRYAQESGR